MKWSAVCCEKAEGLKPGDPVFKAWVRLAATPVREVKAARSRRARTADRAAVAGAATAARARTARPRDDRPAGREEHRALGRAGAAGTV